jgi:hypothetical protein
MVATHNNDWQTMSELWISDGTDDCQGRLEIRVWFDDGSSVDESGLMAATQ